MGVFKRGNRLWITYRAADGSWPSVSSGFRVGQEKQAHARYEALVRAVAAESPDAAMDSGAPDSAKLAVRAYAATWIEERRKLDLDWRNDRGRLDNHVLPVIGDMPIASVRTRHLVELFRDLRTTVLESTGEVMSQRTVYNVYSVVSAMFRDAKLADLSSRRRAS